MDIPISYNAYIKQGRKVFTDSRKPVAGGIFFALKGPNFNGNLFALEVLEKGAAFAVVDEIKQNDERLIKVDDVLTELQQLAKFNRLNCKASVIAITGSNGKTTTKELCFAVFSRQFNTIATSGNLNNHIGLPLTLLQIDENTQFAIVEMGANHPGEIKELCEIALPDAGLITSIGKAHLEGFGTEENILKAKKELFDHLDLHSKKSFYNLIDQNINSIFKKDQHHITYGNFDQQGDFSGVLQQSFPKIIYSFHGPSISFEGESNLFGEYNYNNILSACTLASFFGLGADSIVKGIAEYLPKNMRSEQIQFKNSSIILDAYNANPSSMHAAIEAFDAMEAESKWLVLGAMAELGIYAESEHEELVKLIQNKSFDQLVLIGEPFMKYANNQKTIVFPDVSTCKIWMDQNWPQQVLILIKGSRSSGLEKLIR